MNISFRRLAPHESGAYRAVRLECLRTFPESFGTSYEEQVALPKLAFETYIESHTPDKYTIGGFDQEQLIGICSVSVDTRKKVRHIAEIVQMYVKPEYQGNKVGLDLIKAAMAEALRDPLIEQIVLNVVATNLSANKVYEQAGFTEYGYLRNNFKVGDHYQDQRMMVYYREK